MIEKVESLTFCVSPGGEGHDVTLRVGIIVHLLMHCNI